MLVSIYGLTDPRTGRVRYVGASADPKRRGHEHTGKPIASIRGWVEELCSERLRPGVTILEEVEAALAPAAEARWIKTFPDLLNVAPAGGGRPRKPEGSKVVRIVLYVRPSTGTYLTSRAAEKGVTRPKLAALLLDRIAEKAGG